MKWISVNSQMPPDDHKPVLAVIHGKKVVRAIWVRALTIDCDDRNFEEGSYYDADTDACYWPEGWYEYNETDEMNWDLGTPVTYWMPLPKVPEEEDHD